MAAYAAQVRVTSAEFVRHFGEWQDRAATGPILITHHGRERLVAMSTTSYVDLRERALAEMPLAGIDDDLIEHLAEGVLLVGGALQIIAINRVAAACLNLSCPGIVGTALDRDGGPLSVALARAAHAGEDHVFDARSPSHAGRWLRLRCFPYREGAACLVRDVTEEIAARRRTEERAAIGGALFALERGGHARLSPRGIFVEVDAALAALAGYTPDMLTRTRLIDLLALERRAIASGHLDHVLAGGEARAFDTQLLARCGARQDARIALAPLGADHGEGGAIAVFARA